MEKLIKVDLPSGAKLEISLSPFRVSQALYHAVLEEAKALKLDPKSEVDVNFFKDIFCQAFSSKKIEVALSECMKRATYNGLKIDDSVFEPEEARQDYMDVCFEVGKANILPFTKSLYAKYSQFLSMLKPNVPA